MDDYDTHAPCEAEQDVLRERITELEQVLTDLLGAPIYHAFENPYDARMEPYFRARELLGKEG